MAITRIATLIFRIDPGLKEALRTAAKQEHRFIANMVEVMIRGHCQRTGMATPSHRPIFKGRPSMKLTLARLESLLLTACDDLRGSMDAVNTRNISSV